MALRVRELTDPGLFAGTVGTRRLLKLFEKNNIKATWFIPGHSLETFPEGMSYPGTYLSRDRLGTKISTT